MFYVRFIHCWYYHSLKAKRGLQPEWQLFVSGRKENWYLLDVHWVQAFGRSVVSLNLCTVHCTVQSKFLWPWSRCSPSLATYRLLPGEREGCTFGKARGVFSFKNQNSLLEVERRWNSLDPKVPDSKLDLETASCRNNLKILLIW